MKIRRDFSEERENRSIIVQHDRGSAVSENVIYAVFLYLVLCAVFCKKQKRKIISLFAGTILLTMLLSVGMETLLHAEKVPR